MFWLLFVSLLEDVTPVFWFVLLIIVPLGGLQCVSQPLLVVCIISGKQWARLAISGTACPIPF